LGTLASSSPLVASSISLAVRHVQVFLSPRRCSVLERKAIRACYLSSQDFGIPNPFPPPVRLPPSGVVAAPHSPLYTNLLFFSPALVRSSCDHFQDLLTLFIFDQSLHYAFSSCFLFLAGSTMTKEGSLLVPFVASLFLDFFFSMRTTGSASLS